MKTISALSKQYMFAWNIYRWHCIVSLQNFSCFPDFVQAVAPLKSKNEVNFYLNFMLKTRWKMWARVKTEQTTFLNDATSKRQTLFTQKVAHQEAVNRGCYIQTNDQNYHFFGETSLEAIGIRERENRRSRIKIHANKTNNFHTCRSTSGRWCFQRTEPLGTAQCH